MVEAQNTIVSIAAFRATRAVARAEDAMGRGPVGARSLPSARSIEHRERMLRFLQAAAMEGVERKRTQEGQQRLLL